MAESPKKVLIIEDNRGPRIALAKGLSSRGFEVAEASNAEDAIAIIKSAFASKNNFDLVISDYHLADIRGDGLDVLSNIRNHGIGTPFIFLTAAELDNDEKYQRFFRNHTIAATLKKPVDFATLIPAINQVLNIGSDAIRSKPILLSGINTDGSMMKR